MANGYAAEDSRRKQAKSKSRTSRSRPGFVSSKNLKEIQRLLKLSVRKENVPAARFQRRPQAAMPPRTAAGSKQKANPGQAEAVRDL